MKKKPIKHFVPDKSGYGSGYAACDSDFWAMPSLPHGSEVANTKRGVTCKKCRKTRVFKKLK